MDTSEYRDLFLAEAQEYLQGLNSALLELEHNPSDRETVQEMFRAAHSLKGMSATMGYQLLANLTHQMENVLDLLRQGTLQADRNVANLLFESLDLLETLLERLDEPDSCIEQVDRLVTKLGGACDGNLETEEEPIPNQQAFTLNLDEFEKELIRAGCAGGDRARHLEVELDASCLLKSVRAYMVFKALEKYGHVIKAMPSVQELEEEQFDSTFHVVLLTKASDETVKAELLQIAEVAGIKLQDVQEDVSVPSDAGIVQQAQVVTTAGNDEGKENSESRKNIKRTAEKTIRVETDKLDKLINLVGELVVNRTRVVELGKVDVMAELASAVEQLDRITTDLQSSVMKLRMVPIKQVFDRFPRMVRDLSQEKGKKVNLVIFGEETELDRSIVNQIGDPLVHLLRNSVDHGIEPPGERVSIGKPEEGTVRLEARHEGSYVLIRVSDDGRGMDAERMRQKAVQKGLISSAEAQRMSDEDAIRLIFKNGFSTADQVTDISGRGVGMDAVKTVIESMNGNVDVKTDPGKGTRFYVRLPLTLAIIKALLVEVAGEIYAIPIETIRENLYVAPEDIKTVQGEEVINLRNEVLPLIHLDKVLGMKSKYTDEVLSVVVVEAGDRKTGLVVDVLLGQQEIVIKSLSKAVEGIQGVAGATVLGNGRVALILDISNLI
jgi:two-component system chemotaxis sensor kinase CheA